MIRFSATQEEIESLLRFLARRTRGLRIPGLPSRNGRDPLSGFYMTPMVAAERSELRFRRTPRPFLNALRDEDGPLVWGMRLAADAEGPLAIRRDKVEEKLYVEPEESRLITLALGAPQDPVERRREGVIEVRDWVMPEPEPEDGAPKPRGVLLLPQAYVARNLVERAARRLRRRGHLENGRWHVPPLPQDDSDED
jgi:hypothetical protein